ncbi:MAG: hypothetical protein KF802_11965 [Bdellovibrionaceae bacterium]|nr:hypothetical protein [Pseudobdellovibrionaceae bacterium]MBX3032830.1 hypothetical protein [Pseudobdellovibrionaceae bacterium]
MNIKGLLGPQIMPAVRPTEKVDRTIHSDRSNDRDANGQQLYDEGRKEKPPMSEEQLQKALEHLRHLPAVREHKWTVQLATEDDKRCVLIKDNLGTLIRKIPEAELWSLPLDEPTSKGHLLKKTA